VAEDTFACRLYDRIAQLSPCERILREYQLRLFDQQANPLPFAPFVAVHSDGAFPGRADNNAVATIHHLTVPDTVNLKWSPARPGDDENSPDPEPDAALDFELDVFVDVPDQDLSEKIARQRLSNLGYTGGEAFADDVAEFQRDYKARLPPGTKPGILDDPTRNLLKDVYNSADPQVKTIPEPAP